MDDHKHLFRPLLASATSTSSYSDDNDADNIKFLSSNSSIICRLLSIIFIGVISLWANHEASKGFDVTIINDARDSPAGKRFDLFYVSNDEATRILLNTSAFVENILYPDDSSNQQSKKNIQRVTLRLTSKNTTQITTVEASRTGEFVINIRSSIMGAENVNYAIISAIQRGIARIWMWDGESRAPPRLMDGLVEYISMLAGFKAEGLVDGGELPEFSSQLCWDDKQPGVVAEFLDFCEVRKKGFIRRLNRGLRDGWNNRTVDDALGMKTKHLCDSYKKL